ncbi:MAG: PAS domain S-box protein [Pseudomonadota bacterium]
MPEHQEATKPKILIVEDEAIIALDLKSHLEQMGYTVLAQVNSAEKALEFIEQDLPDLVLMDIILKGKMDGIEGADIIRSRWGIPVVFVTAYADQKRLERAKLVYPFGYIIKPFQDNDIRVTIEMALYVSKVDRERRKAEKALRESQEYFKAIIQNSSDIILIVDKLGTITYASPSIERILGYGPDELIGKRTLDLIVSDDKPRAIADFGRALLTKDPIPNVFRLRHKNGTERILEGIGKNLLDNPFVAGFLMNVRDVTERQRTKEALQQSEKKYRTILESIEEGYFEVDLKGCFTFFNDALSELLGYSQDEIMGKNNRDYMPPRTSEEIFSLFNQIYKTGRPVKKHVYEVIKKDGTHGFHELAASLMRDENGTPTGFCGIAHDITDRKRAEETMQESAELLKNYLENAPDGIYMSDLQGHFLYGNRKCEEIIGYRREELIGKNFLELNLLSENSLTKAAQLLQANMEDGATGPDEIELISKEGLLIPVEINTNVVQRCNQKIVIASVRDITERKQASMKLLLSLEKLRKALGGIIQAMALTVETRDPYTSGHQRRVADLARSIAREMGLPEEQVDGLRMAGIVHDLGKISVPAEILSKPTKLSNLELSLIKVHPQAGYNILKDIDFPWPLAEIVFQHHERMDGSGYPQGLLGANILLEARILAVADVVEAIASHRPYRPALGIDAALEEIQKNRGLLYDAEPVDACLTLFREKGYHLD